MFKINGMDHMITLDKLTIIPGYLTESVGDAGLMERLKKATLKMANPVAFVDKSMMMDHTTKVFG